MATEYTADHWLAKLLRSRASALNDANGRGGTVALAKKLGLSRPTLERWIDGDAAPDVAKAERLIKALGGDLQRAKPDYVPPNLLVAVKEAEALYGKRQEPIRFVGSVRGGELDERADLEREVEFQDIWRESPWWSYTLAEEPVVMVRVVGDSMAPVYPDGCMIAMRRFKPGKLPNGGPCVFRTGRGESIERTFKILRTTKQGDIIGWPLNPEHDPIIFRGAVTLEYVVLGVMDPRPGGLSGAEEGERLIKKLKGGR